MGHRDGSVAFEPYFYKKTITLKYASQQGLQGLTAQR